MSAPQPVITVLRRNIPASVACLVVSFFCETQHGWNWGAVFVALWGHPRYICIDWNLHEKPPLKNQLGKRQFSIVWGEKEEVKWRVWECSQLWITVVVILVGCVVHFEDWLFPMRWIILYRCFSSRGVIGKRTSQMTASAPNILLGKIFATTDSQKSFLLLWQWMIAYILSSQSHRCHTD